MKELVVISGKGGTGKTSLVASFAALAGSVGSRQAGSAHRSDSGQSGSRQAHSAGSGQAGNAVFADCDVDAADLHLVLAPTILRREEFRCGHEAIIRQKDCIGCGACLARCRFDAIRCVTKATCGPQSEHAFVIDPTACEGCGVCVWSCPVTAIDFPERRCGEWYVSDTRHGPMVHARLIPGGENSGKLVSKVRQAARTLAEEREADLILVDGPPGVGCAVIASVTGASQVLVVTEPTLSGAHDMARVLQLTRHFKIPTAICVNKWDLNTEMTERIESKARRVGAMPVGRVRYGRAALEELPRARRRWHASREGRAGSDAPLHLVPHGAHHARRVALARGAPMGGDALRGGAARAHSPPSVPTGGRHGGRDGPVQRLPW